ncbi:MAG TPA: hypothetical protein VMZ28_29080 [Kofleriaceae bacterium]|nr:hypothetical protein [Kofleriaceae bacterium]
MSTARLLPASALALALALGTTADAAKPATTGASTSRARRTAKPTGAAKPARPLRRSSAAAAPITTGRAPRAAVAARGRTAAAPSTSAETSSTRRLTRVQRESAAVTGVHKVLRPWVRGGLGIEVRLAIQQIQISPHNRLLGRGPVEVVVTPKVTAKTTRLQRWTAAFRPSVNRRMMVAVNEYGNATVLDDQPNTIQHRAIRVITDRIPVGEIITDIFTSKQSQAGLVAAAAAIPTFFVNPAAGGAVAVTAAGFIMSGRRERTANRDHAFRETITWARARDKAGNRPALSEMHRYYALQLKNTSTKPITFRKFVERLSLEDFDGQGADVETQDPGATP